MIYHHPESICTCSSVTSIDACQCLSTCASACLCVFFLNRLDSKKKSSISIIFDMSICLFGKGAGRFKGNQTSKSTIFDIRKSSFAADFQVTDPESFQWKPHAFLPSARTVAGIQVVIHMFCQCWVILDIKCNKTHPF